MMTAIQVFYIRVYIALASLCHNNGKQVGKYIKHIQVELKLSTKEVGD